jgi:hypothetical protein
MMDDVIIVQLDSVRKYRNQHEWRPVNRAYATHNGEYLEEVGDHRIIHSLLKSIYSRDPAQIRAIVDVRRGDVPCFVPAPLKQWLFPEKQPIPKGLLDYKKQKHELTEV